MTQANATGPVRVELLDGGALWRVVLGGAKGNVIDRALVDALTRVAIEARTSPDLRAIVLEGDGGHFSYGASVPEHLPAEVAGMLRRFHDLFRAMLDSAVVWVAAVRGRCLGGGLELAAFCQRVVARQDAVLGQPEIVLGVFAPVGSAFLAERVGRPSMEDLCLTGRTITGTEALAMRLVDELDDDPGAAALAWARTHLVPKSASSLRYAVRAARRGLCQRFLAEVDELEHLYLDGLMSTEDAVEGLTAFLRKRPPVWRNR